jgi:hypothetical protein
MRDLDADAFSDPFFHQTLARMPHTSEGTLRVPRILLEQEGHRPLLAPAGIIFHMSRCGSTLLCRMLRHVESCVVFSEPPAINDLLMPPWHDWAEEEITDALRVVMHRLGVAAGGRPFVVKLRSWNTLFAETVERAFPDVPWAMVARDPVEVAASALRRPPTWIRAFAEPSNPFKSVDGVVVGPGDTVEDYTAEMLGAFARAAARLPRTRGRVVAYPELPGAAWDVIAPHFGLRPDAASLDRMRAEATFYSKDATRETPFVPDSHEKQLAATTTLRRALAERAQPFVDDLLTQRNGQ